MLRLPDHWVWDHWFLPTAAESHLFFLRASRALQDPDRRHQRAAIGHAVRGPGGDWELVSDALVHADEPAFDSRACWTGSALELPDGRVRLFYTGVSAAENGTVQRIGWADSLDGRTFDRVAPAALEADPRWYEADPAAAGEVHWRDPFVFAGDDGLWHMLITARSREGEVAGRGVVGHAVSRDLDTWEVQPPLTDPAGFWHLEVCQQFVEDGQHWLLFSCPQSQVPEASRTPGGSEIWVARGDSALGPWDIAGARPVGPSDYYAGQALRDADGTLMLSGFRNIVDGQFLGEVGPPVPLLLPSSTD